MDYQVSDFLSPNQWEADTQPCGHAGYARQPDTVDTQTLETFLQTQKDISEITFDVKGVHGREKVTIQL